MQFIGRQTELQQLSRFLERSPDSLAVVYGRRRVGKSELLRQAIRASNLPYVFFECRQTSESEFGSPSGEHQHSIKRTSACL